MCNKVQGQAVYIIEASPALVPAQLWVANQKKVHEEEIFAMSFAMTHSF